MYKINKTLLILIVFVLFANCTCAFKAPPFKVAAQSCYFADVKTGNVLFAQNEDAKIPAASLTKIVTVLVAYDKIKDLNTKITAPRSVFDELYKQNAMLVGISAGEEVRAIDLICATMIASACEAASILAYEIGHGSLPNFVKMMNEKAKELGATNTHFVDAHGLSDKNYSTAKDMYLITKEAIKNPKITEMVAKSTYKIPATNKRKETEIYTSIKMLNSSDSYYYNKIKGFKTGSLEGFQNFVSLSSADEMTIVGVVLGAPPNKEEKKYQAFVETKKVLKWIYDNFGSRLLAEKNALLDEVKLVGSLRFDHVGVVTNADVYGVLPNDAKLEDVTKKCTLPKSVAAGTETTEKIGKATFFFDDNKLAEADLFLAKTVKASSLEKILYAIKAHIKVALLILGCVAMLISRIINLKNKRWHK
ncbi:hypothetical protein FACS189481_2950 [Clostridia bacterium]|nr:hypothetical protein FACS189481_2950 [Clostridia bacterium]